MLQQKLIAMKRLMLTLKIRLMMKRRRRERKRRAMRSMIAEKMKMVKRKLSEVIQVTAILLRMVKTMSIREAEPMSREGEEEVEVGGTEGSIITVVMNMPEELTIHQPHQHQVRIEHSTVFTSCPVTILKVNTFVQVRS